MTLAELEVSATPILLYRRVDSDASSAFKTVTGGQRSLVPLEVTRQTLADLGLILIQKRTAVYLDRISVGRTRNNDIVIDHPKVSKLHAHFSVTGAGEVTLTDRGSSNGTFVENAPLTQMQPAALFDGASIHFWQLQFRFYTAAGAHRLAAQLIAG